MGILRKYKHFILLVTLPVFLMFMLNSLINRHSHFVNGYIFSHAHPFSKDTGESGHPFHTHTDAELQILDLISDVDILVVFIFLVLLHMLVFNKLLARTCKPFYPGPVILPFSPRGPPLCA